MSNWFNTKSFTNIATTALKTAQKRIDKVLDIREEEGVSRDASTLQRNLRISPQLNIQQGRSDSPVSGGRRNVLFCYFHYQISLQLNFNALQ